MRPTNYLQQNTVCLVQQIYASQENFIQTLVVMVEPFRRSAENSTISVLKCASPLQLACTSLVHYSPLRVYFLPLILQYSTANTVQQPSFLFYSIHPRNCIFPPLQSKGSLALKLYQSVLQCRTILKLFYITRKVQCHTVLKLYYTTREVQ